MIKNICSQFQIRGDFVKSYLVKGGNINQTYLAEFINNGKIDKYIVQKVNNYVFSEPQKVIENISKITKHLMSKRKDESGIIHLIDAFNGLKYFIDENNDFWRVYNYIENSITFDKTNDLFIIKEAGIGFGKFQNELSDFSPQKIVDIINDFHNTKLRFINLFKSEKEDKLSRKQFVIKELDYLHDNFKWSTFYENLKNEQKLPIRIVHNDTKCNNILFDVITRKQITVIDLDTVMTGIIAYDFGDGCRSICSTSEEDADHNYVDFDILKYSAFAEGYLSEIKGFITLYEAETLYLAPFIMTLELSARFLQDYLEGDMYFKCEYKDQNLMRAKNQIALSKKIYEKLAQIKQITEKILKDR